MSYVRVRFKRVKFWHRPFELDIEVHEGEEIDDAIDRNWCSGLIPDAAECVVEATDVEDWEVVKP